VEILRFCPYKGDLTCFVMNFLIHSTLTIRLTGGGLKNGYVVFCLPNNGILIFRA